MRELKKKICRGSVNSEVSKLLGSEDSTFLDSKGVSTPTLFCGKRQLNLFEICGERLLQNANGQIQSKTLFVTPSIIFRTLLRNHVQN